MTVLALGCDTQCHPSPTQTQGFIQTGSEHTCRCTPKPKLQVSKVCACPEGHEPLGHVPGSGEAVVLGKLVPDGAAAAAKAAGAGAAALGFGRRLLGSEDDCYCRKSPPPPTECTCKEGWVPLVDDLKHLGSQVGCDGAAHAAACFRMGACRAVC